MRCTQLAFRNRYIATMPNRQKQNILEYPMNELDYADVEETIELMTSQADGLPLVSSSETQAQYNREMFNETVLVPSQDIVSCATSILEDLSSESNSSSTAYEQAETVAKKLSESIQPFIQHLNHLNEMYTRLHLFHVIVNKTNRWNKKASSFISRKLICCKKRSRYGSIRVISKNIDTSGDTNTVNNVSAVPRLVLDIADDDEEEDAGGRDTTGGYERIFPPTDWSPTLQHFYKKHPPPKKKHIRLLNKFVPSHVNKACRSDAEVLAERTLFILQFLQKHEFKRDDVLMIQRWTRGSDIPSLENCSHVTLV